MLTAHGTATFFLGAIIAVQTSPIQKRVWGKPRPLYTIKPDSSTFKKHM
jgi:hypothetical protein